MYYVLIRSIRSGDGYVVKNFFSSFKKNLKQATIAWLLIVILGIVLGMDMYFWYVIVQGTMGKVMFVLTLALTFAFYIMVLYLFPIIAKFENKLIVHMKNAAAMAIGYFKYTAIILVINGIFFYANYKSIAANVIMIFIGFAVLAYILSFFFYRVFMEHMDERYDDFYVDEEIA